MNVQPPGCFFIQGLARTLDRIEAMATAAHAHMKSLSADECDDVALHLFDAINRETKDRAVLDGLEEWLADGLSDGGRPRELSPNRPRPRGGVFRSGCHLAP